MDSLTFETYSTYSDSSAPRTPSPVGMLQYHNPVIDYKGSLLHELYEQDMPPEYQQFEHSINWQRPSDYPLRRATFPYVRHDQPYHPYDQHYSSRQEPYPPYHDFEDPNIKLEAPPPRIVQHHQSNFYRSPPSSCHQIPMPYNPPHTSLPIQHTDDAASKETQYLRRRCFNCHTTEPPSWRRSTLNPGKIVCNKCGLYERTHLRARPLRFDELRSGTKSRKLSKAGSSTTSPKQQSMIKKEPGEFGLDNRRSSSVSSAAASPVSHSFRDSHSPPQEGGGIRLPNNPLSDVASMCHASITVCVSSSSSSSSPQSVPRESHSYYSSSPPMSEANLIPQLPEYFPHSASPESC